MNIHQEHTDAHEESFSSHGSCFSQEDLISQETLQQQQTTRRLAVVVLSRLQHSEQRRAIRETWAKSAAKHGAKLVSFASLVVSYLLSIALQVFGMGEAACHLPTIWRARPHFCTEWQLKVAFN